MRAADKVLSREAVAQRLAAIRQSGGKIIFTCGVFDLLHVGHVRYLEFARALGSVLVVGINSDESARALGKGSGRPWVDAVDRAELVAALSSVDYVFIFDEPRPNESIRSLRPHVHVKDEAYKDGELPESATVAEVGASIVFAPHVAGRSSTILAQKMGWPQP